MFGYPSLNKGFNLIKILNGLSKTLTVANKVIPMYQKAKPIVSNTKNLFDILKNINIIDSNDTKKNIIQKKEEPKFTSSSNNPIFFI
ncbi:MAG: hypothetical protein E7158_04155 [Firmicutes bacterium]|nr:hypothetical protein [Bacillota bacterium]